MLVTEAPGSCFGVFCCGLVPVDITRIIQVRVKPLTLAVIQLTAYFMCNTSGQYLYPMNPHNNEHSNNNEDSDNIDDNASNNDNDNDNNNYINNIDSDDDDNDDGDDDYDNGDDNKRPRQTLRYYLWLILHDVNRAAPRLNSAGT